ncbi:MAG TPA: hypothetical protein VN370_08225 [Desulfitobacteriaceae bacterium]|nr:hypothetical protein [Desulfitobacteriaceae bacterium]
MKIKRREIQVSREPFSRKSVSERNGAALRSAKGLVHGWTDAAFAMDG